MMDLFINTLSVLTVALLAFCVGRTFVGRD